MLLVGNSMFSIAFSATAVISKKNKNYKTYIFNEIKNWLKLWSTAFEEYSQMLGTLGEMETKPQASACSSKFQLDPSNYHVNKADKAKKSLFVGSQEDP